MFDHCNCQCAPDLALRALVDHDGPLLLDLDETAYLSNSTEDFLDTARPGLLALMLLRMLDAIRPWRWTGGEETRDFWRVRTVTLLMPWIWRRWRGRVDSLASNCANQPLLDAVRRRNGETIFVTVGFEPIVTPLVTALGFPDARVVACRLSTPADRRRGKLATAIDALGEEVIQNSAVLTDSLNDLPLLSRCARPLLTVWKEARYRRALRNFYLPGQYLTQIKRPGERYIVHGIVLEDFALWVLSSIFYAASPFAHVIGLLALLISFWAIYESGYVENDQMAHLHEDVPTLSDAFGTQELVTTQLQPWIWATIFGLLGVSLLSSDTMRGIAAWTGVLLGTRLCFWFYNRIDKSSRVWLYPALQLARSASFAVLVPIDLPALLAVGAHVIARWIPYYGYRSGTQIWPDLPVFLMRLVFFTILCAVAATQNVASLLTPTALVLASWNVFRARRELLKVFKGLHRIDRTGHTPP
jgi:hypothetical protein